MSYKQAIKEELEDSTKYVKFSAKTIKGESIKIISSIDMEKVNKDLEFARYNMLIT